MSWASSFTHGEVAEMVIAETKTQVQSAAVLDLYLDTTHVPQERCWQLWHVYRVETAFQMDRHFKLPHNLAVGTLECS
jgi:hypothetical protein